MKNLTWNQFLSACSIAWQTDGNMEKDVHCFLLACEKNSSMGKIQVASSAYQLYKKNKQS